MNASTDTLTNPNLLTDDGGIDAARRAKVEELQRRRAARSDTAPTTSAPAAPAAPAAPMAPRSRAGAAQGSKIAAAGFGLATMLGLVAAMGFASSSAAETPPAPVATVPPAQVVVVIHPADGTTATAAAGAVPGTPGVVAATPSQPIVLSAQPVVQQAPASQAPAGQTNGSR